MKTTHWSLIALGLTGVALFAVSPTGAGCVEGGTGGSGTGAMGGGGSGAGGSGVTSSGGTGGHGTGGAPTHHTCATAAALQVDGSKVAATLAGATTPDFYRLTGMQGDTILVRVLAQELAQTNGYDPTITDTVLTLYGPGMKQIANNNDGWLIGGTDSQLYFELPADGSYCLSVEDCNSFAITNASVKCNPVSGVKTFDYQLFAVHAMSSSYPEINAGTMQDGTTAKAPPVVYQMAGSSYGRYTLDGNFTATGAAKGGTHVFQLAPPVGTPAGTGQRARAEFWVQTQGADDGDGSTSPVKVWLTDDAAGQHVIARADQNDYTTGNDPKGGPLDLSLPLPSPIATPTTYYLFVQSTATTSSPTTDDYFIQHYIGNYFGAFAEKEGPAGQGMNDTLATAETLHATPTDATQFVIDGNVSAPGTAAKPDLDWFTVPVPGKASTVGVTCEAARVGSGLGGFQAQVFAADGTTSLTVLGPEAPAPKTTLSGTASIGSNASLLLEISASTQDPTNAGTGYRCFLSFK